MWGRLQPAINGRETPGRIIPAPLSRQGADYTVLPGMGSGAPLALGFLPEQDQFCKVYCNSGVTSVNASSASDAAAKADKQGDPVCKSDNRGNVSSQTLRPEQCRRK